MDAQPSTIEFYERRPLQEFAVGVRKFVPLRVTNLEVDYDDGLWIYKKQIKINECKK